LFALRGAIFHTRRLVDDGMSPESFEAMREYIDNYSKLWVQNLDRRLGYQLDSSFYQTDFYIDEIERRLKTMSVDDVNRAVKKHLDRWDFTVAIVAANAAELKAAIQRNAESPISYQTAGAAADVLEEDEIIEVYELPIDRVRVVPVDTLFESVN
jgi:zinc protease